MFTPRFHDWRLPFGWAAQGRAAGAGGDLRIAGLVRPALIGLFLAASLPNRVSAQAAGTMQATARVLPGLPGWAGVAAARTLARDALSAPQANSRSHSAGLVRAWAELTSGQGRRRLLIMIHYPHN
jgi:hypothetical protein